MRYDSVKELCTEILGLTVVVMVLLFWVAVPCGLVGR
jgi:hypothetical protein